MTRSVALLFLSAFISSLSQVLLKKSSLRGHKSIAGEYLNPLVLSAYAIFAVAVLLDLLALRHVPLSFVPVAEASGYLFALLSGKLFFGESFPARKVIALSLILAGIAVFML